MLGRLSPVSHVKPFVAHSTVFSLISANFSFTVKNRSIASLLSNSGKTIFLSDKASVLSEIQLPILSICSETLTELAAFTVESAWFDNQSATSCEVLYDPSVTFVTTSWTFSEETIEDSAAFNLRLDINSTLSIFSSNAALGAVVTVSATSWALSNEAGGLLFPYADSKSKFTPPSVLAASSKLFLRVRLRNTSGFKPENAAPRRNKRKRDIEDNELFIFSLICKPDNLLSKLVSEEILAVCLVVTGHRDPTVLAI
mmetsp:Transcript_19335/g.28614  ORF Transcript_19335/g.28614 Transcript_19335/m.28614 type:complete len:256 (+) Transcript_19335:963-1730(+)